MLNNIVDFKQTIFNKNMDLFSQLDDRIKKQFSLDKLIAFFSIDVPYHGVLKNSRSVFNHPRTGKAVMTKSKRAESAKKFLTLALKSQANNQRLFDSIKEPVWVIFHFYFDNYYTEKGKMSKNIGDLSNLYQLPEDCLQEAGILEDDQLIYSHDLSRRLSGIKNKLEIFILKYED